MQLKQQQMEKAQNAPFSRKIVLRRIAQHIIQYKFPAF